MNIYTLLALIVGIILGANFGFLIASFMRANDEEVLDK
jgi:hypothetical protein